MRRSIGPRPAFTLIELLVVVAIIALLISILLPSLNAARRQARQVICNTNLKSQGQGVQLYAVEYKGWIVRGIAGFSSNVPEYNIYAYAILPYIGVPDIQKVGLFKGGGRTPPNPPPQPLNVAFANNKLLNCPDHPEPLSPLDYVANAAGIPYTTAAINGDAAGGGQNGDQFQGENPPTKNDYIAEFRIDTLDRAGGGGLAGRLVLATEGHRSLPASLTASMRYHHFFFTSQLPFGQYPRIANDQRHPGGINAMFFDGHSATIPLRQFDVGWGNSLGRRLRYVTVVPQQYY